MTEKVQLVILIRLFSRYQPNETVEVECVSKGGYPPPKITWFINGEKVRYLIIH